MKKMLLLIAALISMNLVAVAQEFDYGDAPALHVDVNGLFGDEKYSDEIIVEKLGAPTDCRKFNNGKYGIVRCYEYRYGDDPTEFEYFSLNDINGLHRFEISTSKFKFFQGQLKVGDKFTKLSQITSGYVERVGVDLYHYWYDDQCQGLPLEIAVDNSGRIEKFRRGVTEVKF